MYCEYKNSDDSWFQDLLSKQSELRLTQFKNE